MVQDVTKMMDSALVLASLIPGGADRGCGDRVREAGGDASEEAAEEGIPEEAASEEVREELQEASARLQAEEGGGGSGADEPEVRVPGQAVQVRQGGLQGRHEELLRAGDGGGRGVEDRGCGAGVGGADVAAGGVGVRRVLAGRGDGAGAGGGAGAGDGGGAGGGAAAAFGVVVRSTGTNYPAGASDCGARIASSR